MWTCTFLFSDGVIDCRLQNSCLAFAIEWEGLLVSTWLALGVKSAEIAATTVLNMLLGYKTDFHWQARNREHNFWCHIVMCWPQSVTVECNIFTIAFHLFLGPTILFSTIAYIKSCLENSTFWFSRDYVTAISNYLFTYLFLKWH
jgi:hypothetical protein